MVFFSLKNIIEQFRFNDVLIFSVKISNISLLILSGLMALLFFRFVNAVSTCACNITGNFLSCFPFSTHLSIGLSLLSHTVFRFHFFLDLLSSKIASIFFFYIIFSQIRTDHFLNNFGLLCSVFLAFILNSFFL